MILFIVIISWLTILGCMVLSLHIWSDLGSGSHKIDKSIQRIEESARRIEEKLERMDKK